jgi:hypothetical protein
MKGHIRNRAMGGRGTKNTVIGGQIRDRSVGRGTKNTVIEGQIRSGAWREKDKMREEKRKK